MEEIIDLAELENLFDWIVDREYEDITWEEFENDTQFFVDKYYDNYLDWLETEVEE